MESGAHITGSVHIDNVTENDIWKHRIPRLESQRLLVSFGEKSISQRVKIIKIPVTFYKESSIITHPIQFFFASLTVRLLTLWKMIC